MKDMTMGSLGDRIANEKFFKRLRRLAKPALANGDTVEVLWVYNKLMRYLERRDMSVARCGMFVAELEVYLGSTKDSPASRMREALKPKGARRV